MQAAVPAAYPFPVLIQQMPKISADQPRRCLGPLGRVGYPLYLHWRHTMAKLRIAKWGNSLALRLPAAFAKQLELHEGSPVVITVEAVFFRLRQSLRRSRACREPT